MRTKEQYKITTIKLEKDTKDRLNHLREYRRETYEEILQKLLNILNICRFNPERARARLISIDRQKRKQKNVRIKNKAEIITQKSL